MTASLAAKGNGLNSPICDIEFVILGTSQDAGTPQIGNPDDPAWAKQDLRRLAASGALVNRLNNRRYLFEATPDMREQIYHLDTISDAGDGSLGLSGIFLTHAHIGHYAGLIFVGHESASARNIKTYVMPRMKQYLQTNGPWDQLVRYKNIQLMPLSEGKQVALDDNISVTPYGVPHRDEYSETVGFVIKGPNKAILFLPDIDDWDRWETEFGRRIEDMIASVDVAYLDATFFDNNELKIRDASLVPHPRLADSIARFSVLPPLEKSKIRFFHLNHTNKARFEDSSERKKVNESGFRIAQRDERICLD